MGDGGGLPWWSLGRDSGGRSGSLGFSCVQQNRRLPDLLDARSVEVRAARDGRLTKHSTAGVDAFIVFAVLVVGLTLTRDPRAMLGRFVVLGTYPMLCGFGYLGGRLPSTPIGVIGVFFLAGGVGMVVLVVARARRGGACESCGRSAMPDRRAPWDGGHCQRQGAGSRTPIPQVPTSS